MNEEDRRDEHSGSFADPEALESFLAGDHLLSHINPDSVTVALEDFSLDLLRVETLFGWRLSYVAYWQSPFSISAKIPIEPQIGR